MKARDAPGYHARDLRDREISLGRQQPLAARMHPLALVVELADHARAHVRMPVVELLLQLVLDHLAFLFHHQDFLQTLREFTHAVRFQRPGHRDLEQPNADLCRVLLGDAQFLERFEHVHVGLAGGDDAEPGIGRIDGRAVNLVQARISHRCIDLVVLHQRFLLARLHAEGIVRQAIIEAAFRHHEIRRHQRFHTEWVGFDRGGRFDGIGQRLEADGASGKARHRPAMQSEFDVFLHVARIQHRNHRSGKQVVALMRQCRRVGAVVVASDQ